MHRVVVVGAGVIGLTCAVRLAEAGHPVDVLARDLPAETTSALGGGLWLPAPDVPTERDGDRDGELDGDQLRWARTSHGVLTALADDVRSGVQVLPGRLLRPGSDQPPPWAGPLSDLVTLAPATAPQGRLRVWETTLPVVDPGRYLPYLVTRLTAAGGTLTRLPLAGLPPRGLVVNCTGLAARALAADPTVRPVRDQLLLLDDPGLDRWWSTTGDTAGAPTYVLPRGRQLVVGGTAEPDRWDTDPDPDTATAVLRRAAALDPRLADLPVRAHRVAVRPARPRVRLQVEHRRDDDGRPAPVVHCYGHGGAGLAASWGCADDVVALVAAADPSR